MENRENFKETQETVFYGLNDMAKVGCKDCQGCYACCQGMGASVVLNPYDVWLLTKNLKLSFEQLVMEKAELNVVNGVILPNLKMAGEEEKCSFLNEEGRCGIHPFRPGICRIFPLGRDYSQGHIRYFLLEEGCIKKDRTKVKVRKWLDREDMKKNQEFLVEWHRFLKTIRQRLRMEDVSEAKTVNMYILKSFFFAPYKDEEDFYGQFYTRLRKAEEDLKLKTAAQENEDNGQ